MDAIDTMTGKLELIEQAQKAGTTIIFIDKHNRIDEKEIRTRNAEKS